MSESAEFDGCFRFRAGKGETNGGSCIPNAWTPVNSDGERGEKQGESEAARVGDDAQHPAELTLPRTHRSP